MSPRKPAVRLDPVFLVYSFRYALGRRSMAVYDVASALIANVGVLQSGHKLDMIRAIDEAIAENRAGQETDIAKWREVREAMAA